MSEREAARLRAADLLEQAAILLQDETGRRVHARLRAVCDLGVACRAGNPDAPEIELRESWGSLAEARAVIVDAGLIPLQLGGQPVSPLDAESKGRGAIAYRLPNGRYGIRPA